ARVRLGTKEKLDSGDVKRCFEKTPPLLPRKTTVEGRRGLSMGNDHVLVVGFRSWAAIGAGQFIIRGAADAVVNADHGRCRSGNRSHRARSRFTGRTAPPVSVLPH